MVTILQKDDPILRVHCAPVKTEEIKTPAIQRIIKDMKKALDSQEDGVAIAAPQIGVALQIFVISKKVFELIDESMDEPVEKKSKKMEKKYEDLVCINPVIIKLSKEKKWLPEGCLSIRYLYGKTKRSVKAAIKAYDEHGHTFTRGGSGLLAQVFQHETDHLHGILFTDTAKNIEDLPPKEKNKK